jgi:hypothetical protein
MTIDCQTQSEYTALLLMSPTDECLSQALMCDGYRCAITGRYNATSVENGVPVAGNVLARVKLRWLISSRRLLTLGRANRRETRCVLPCIYSLICNLFPWPAV